MGTTTTPRTARLRQRVSDLVPLNRSTVAEEAAIIRDGAKTKTDMMRTLKCSAMTSQDYN